MFRVPHRSLRQSERSCSVAGLFSRQAACETAVMSALGTEHALNVMTRGQSKAKQSGQADQGAEQQGPAAEADHDMHDADTDDNGA